MRPGWGSVAAVALVWAGLLAATNNPPLPGGWCLFCLISVVLPRRVAEPLLLGLRLRRPRWRADRCRLGRLYVQRCWEDLLEVEMSHAVDLSVTLTRDDVDTLKEVASRRGTTVTEVLRRAIAMEKFIDDATLRGDRLRIVHPDGTVRVLIVD